MTPQTQTLQSVQVFRAAAVLLVLLFHATAVSRVYLNYDLLGGLFLFGYSGVDVFFVLSGFIICLIHRGDVGRPDRLTPYLKKRLIRIYPVYWIVALALMPVYFGLPHHASEYVVLVKSFLLLPEAVNPVVTVAWSLAHELFFYGMFGLAIAFSWRRTRPLVLAWLLAAAGVYFGNAWTSGEVDMPAHTGFALSSYNLEFATGCAAAYLLGRYPLTNGRRLAIMGAVIFLLCGVSESALHAHFGRRHSVLAYGLPAMLMIWGAVLLERRSTLVMPPLLLLLGDASYSIYLTHYALLDLFVRACRSRQMSAAIGPAAAAGMAIAFALGIGVLFYLYVERPVLAQLRRRSRLPDAYLRQTGITI